MLPFSEAFQNNLNYAFITNILEVMKFYNQGDHNFETDMDLMIIVISGQLGSCGE